MDTLIYDDLKIREWQTESFSNNIINARELINLYPQLSEDDLHDIDDLEVLAKDEQSVVYQFDNIVLKYIIDDVKSITEGFYREIIIGLEINKLNNDSFVRTVGYYISNENCYIPKVDKNKTCIYLYVKKVQGPTLTKFIPTASFVQFKDIMMKLLLAYKNAREKLDFCHYDLHSNNVIISNKNEELIPVIIDFGASHIKLKEGNIGELWSKEGRYDGIALWVYDIFKIFAFCYQFSLDSYQQREIEQEFITAKEEYYHYIYNMSEYVYPSLMFRYNEQDEKINETPEQFLTRVEDNATFMNKKLSVQYIRDILIKADEHRKRRNKLLNENYYNILEINKYCQKVLEYFHPDASQRDWLNRYRLNVSLSWGVSVTKLGSNSSFDDFIKYVEKI